LRLPSSQGFPGGYEKAVGAAPSILRAAYYPFAKRHMKVPQLVLGFCLSWGVVVGALALGVEAVGGDWSVWAVDIPLAGLFLGCTLWTVIYDTIYAHLDLAVDLQLVVGSTAVLFQGYTKHFLWTALALMSASLTTVGFAGNFGLGFFRTCCRGFCDVFSVYDCKCGLGEAEQYWVVVQQWALVHSWSDWRRTDARVSFCPEILWMKVGCGFSVT
jgi:hypothetical protein